MTRRLVALALTFAVLAAAACRNPVQVAETPMQKFYAALGMYSVYAAVAANYVESPSAHPTAVRVIQDVDREAQETIDRVLEAGLEAGDDRWALAGHLLASLTEKLRRELTRHGVIEEGAALHRSVPVRVAEVSP